MNKINLTDTFQYKVIYVYTIPDEAHAGRVKIGETTLNTDHYYFKAPVQERQNLLREVVENRINQQTKTADIEFVLLHCEIAETADKKGFNDIDVHNVLRRSGFEKKSVRKGAQEWFECTKEIAVLAIEAVKAGKKAIDGAKIVNIKEEFIFRDSQREAIDKTIKNFKLQKNTFLWNAKMRFGKTAAAMQVAKEMNFAKTLIITHRPAVADGWFEDFNKIFAATDWLFGSNDTIKRGETFQNLLNRKNNFIYFASIQDLRLSKEVIKDSKSLAEGFEKNEEIFSTFWDFLIIDEAHEGTQSALGQILDEKIKRNYTLYLSGTPFNLLEKRENDEIYTWDYVMEQQAKENWETEHPDQPNPYASLPRLSMFTYELNKYITQPDFEDVEDKAFNFREFFRTDEDGNFIYKENILKFLDLLTNVSDSNFPFSTEEYRNFICHSLWLVPGVKEAAALSKMLREHFVFSNFGIANVAGNEEIDAGDALKTVKDTIKKYKYSITLTCGKLTTGVNIPEWTAVFMLSNTTSATTYLQTAFRCQTPFSFEGKMKTQCYVFDFAPDRTLQIVAEAAELRTKAGETNRREQREYMEKFLNFCPIIAATDGKMQPYDVNKMLEELKKAAIARVVRNGFDDAKMYNDNLMNLSDVDLQDFEKLHKIVGASKQTKIPQQLEINNQGFNQIQIEAAEQAEKKPKRERTPEEEALVEELKRRREDKRKAITILRGISIRIPLLIFGAKVDTETQITPESFVDLIDAESWAEFMPKDVDKELFCRFLKYYDEDVFVGAGLNIRRKALAADQLFPFERIEALAAIFATFKNPDKETVLTPWRVVNKHISSTLGGNNFNEKLKENSGEEYELPLWVDMFANQNINPVKFSKLNRDSLHSVWEKNDCKILEINSKSGLYPLLATYNIYDRTLKKQNIKLGSQGEKQKYDEIWRKILAENIFVVCKTPMAEAITQRTLAGFTDAKINTMYIENLTKKFREDKSFNFKNNVYKYFNLDNNMKFDAIIGNPPYQETTNGNNYQIHFDFLNQAFDLTDNIVSFIQPLNWLDNTALLKKVKRNLIELYRFSDSKEIFNEVSIPSGVGFYLIDKTKKVTKTKIFDHSKIYELDITGNQNIDDIRISEEVKFKKSIAFRISDYQGFPNENKSLNVKEKRESSKDIEIWYKKDVGKSGKNKWYFVDRKDIPEGKIIDEWKVMITSDGHAEQTESKPQGIFNNLAQVLSPMQITTNRPFLLKVKDEKEGKLLAQYANSRFFRRLLHIRAKSNSIAQTCFELVPDIEEFSNKFYTEKPNNIDEFLFKFYNLSEETINDIFKRISEKNANELNFLE